jgi:hypothetical protein
MRRWSTTAMLAFAGALAVAGCSSDSTSIGALEASTSARPLPDEVATSRQFDTASARFVASDDGFDYYVARPKDRGNEWACLIRVPTEGDWSGGCSSIGSGQVIVTIGGEGSEAVLVGDDADTGKLAKDGWIQVHENLWVLH